MNNMLKVALTSLCFAHSVCATAGEALDNINAEVEQRAQQMDQDYGVLLTGQERQDLKISLIVDKVSTAQQNVPVQEKTATAIAIYEIIDPADQRQLFIKMNAIPNLGGGSSGDDPN